MVRASLTCCLCMAVARALLDCYPFRAVALGCTCSCGAKRMSYRIMAWACLELSASSEVSFLPAHSLVSWLIVRGEIVCVDWKDAWAEGERAHGCGAWMQGLHLPGVGRVQGLPYEGTAYGGAILGEWMGRDMYELRFRTMAGTRKDTAARPIGRTFGLLTIHRQLPSACNSQVQFALQL